MKSNINQSISSGTAKVKNAGRALWSDWKTGWQAMKIWQKVVTVAILVIFLFAFYVVLDANKYPALVRVIEGEGKVGVNPTDRALDFGDLSRGTSAVRRVNIKNGTPMPMYVMIFKFGGISDLVQIDKNFFKLQGGQEEKIEFTTYMPASAPIDSNYTGRVFLFKIPTFWTTGA
jgi:hypothetical protein